MLNEQNQEPLCWAVGWRQHHHLFLDKEVNLCEAILHIFIEISFLFLWPGPIHSLVLPPGKSLKGNSGGEDKDLFERLLSLAKINTEKKRNSVDEGSP